MASSIGSRDSVSFLLTIQATGLLTFTLVGLPPTEYASLRWTHLHAGLSRRTTQAASRRPQVLPVTPKKARHSACAQALDGHGAVAGRRRSRSDRPLAGP